MVAPAGGGVTGGTIGATGAVVWSFLLQEAMKIINPTTNKYLKFFDKVIIDTK